MNRKSVFVRKNFSRIAIIYSIREKMQEEIFEVRIRVDKRKVHRRAADSTLANRVLK
jgi:hypothetical protein